MKFIFKYSLFKGQTPVEVDEIPLFLSDLDLDEDVAAVTKKLGKRLNESELEVLHQDMRALVHRYNLAFYGLWDDLGAGKFRVEFITAGNRTFSLDGANYSA